VDGYRQALSRFRRAAGGKAWFGVIPYDLLQLDVRDLVPESKG